MLICFIIIERRGGSAGSPNPPEVSFFGEEHDDIRGICSFAHKTKAKVMIFREISLIKAKFSLILILLIGFILI